MNQALGDMGRFMVHLKYLSSKLALTVLLFLKCNLRRYSVCCRASKPEASVQGSRPNPNRDKILVSTHNASGFFNHNATDFARPLPFYTLLGICLDRIQDFQSICFIDTKATLLNLLSSSLRLLQRYSRKNAELFPTYIYACA